MARMMRVCLLLLLFAPAFTAEESSFALWTPAAIGQREAALMKNVAPDRSSRETLADYGDHRFRLLYRDADGLPEEHDKIVDVVVVHSGEGALMLGGTMSGKKGSAETGEYLGPPSPAARCTRSRRAISFIFQRAFRTASSCRTGSTSHTSC
jgi:hypothetical protein